MKYLDAGEELWAMLSQLKVVRFTATFQAGNQGLFMPRYKGSLFRGAMGHAFRELTCADPIKGIETPKLPTPLPRLPTKFQTPRPDQGD